MEDMYFCDWLRGAEKRSNFKGEIGLFQERREDRYSIIAALHTETSRHILAGGTHCGLLGEGNDWSTLDAAIDHMAVKADDMRRKLLVSGLAEAYNADGAKFAIVCFRPLIPRERASAFRLLGRLSVDLSRRFEKHVLVGGDVGTRPGDLSFAALASSDAFSHVVGQSPEYGGVDETGPPTAKGVMEAIELAFRMYSKMYREGGLLTKTMAVKGLGSVGGSLVREAIKRGWDIVIADTNSQKINELQASLPHPMRMVESSHIHKESVTVFAPCAIHPVITKETAGEFQCKIIMSGQNNDVDPSEARHLAAVLHARGIAWGPGYVNNPIGIAMLLRQKDRATLSYETIFGQEITRHKARVKQILWEAAGRGVPIFTVTEELIHAALR